MFMSLLKSLIPCLVLFNAYSSVGYTKTRSFEVLDHENPYFQIAQIKVTEVQTQVPFYIEDISVTNNKNIQTAVMIVDGLLAIGKKVWPIIEANKPVINVDNKMSLSVVPKIADTPNSDIPFLLTNWSIPKKKSFRVSYLNGFGSEVIGFTYSILYQHGGKHNDFGQYLTGVNVIVDKVNVSWGFNFSAKTSLMSIVNHGSKKDPVAGASFKISYIAKSILKEIRAEDGFHIQGNGILNKL